MAGAALTALLLTTTSCSSVPDSLNPGKMADSVGRVLDSGPPVEGEDQPSPNLSTVPGRVRPSPAQNRQRIANELSSDRANARYSDDPVGQRTPEAAPPAAAATPALTSAPAAPKPADAPKPANQPAVELDEAGQPKINTGYYATEAPAKPAREAPPAPVPADVVPDAPPPPPVLTEPYKRGGPVPVRPTQADSSTPLPPPGIQPPVANAPAASAPVASAPPPSYAPPAYTPPPYTPPAAPAYVPPAPMPAPALPAMPVLGQVAIIYFADGATSPTASDLTVLRQVADLFRQQGGHLRVVGHSSQRSNIMDPVKRQLGYLDESSKRADAVARALAKLGIPGSQIGVEAAGASQPLYDEGTSVGEAGNRRVEIFLDN